MLNGTARMRVAGILLKMAAASLILLLCAGSVLATEPPAWQPFNPNPTNPVQPGENESSVKHEKREYTREDGTKVSEERLVITEYKDGEYKYTKTYTWSSETNGEDKTESKGIELVDAAGKRTFSRQWSVTKRVKGGLRTDYFVEEGGKVFYTGYLMKHDRTDKQEAKDVTKEKESKGDDAAGSPTEKTTYKLLADGSVITEKFVWSQLKRDWTMYASTEAVKPAAPAVAAPSMSTFGFAVGGSLGNDAAALLAVSGVKAKSASGKVLDIEVSDSGRWLLGPGVLSPGLWELSAVMVDGRLGPASKVIVIPALETGGRPVVGGVPRMLFVDSYVALTGEKLSSKSHARVPEVLLASGSDAVLIEPYAFSDREILAGISADAPIGWASIMINSGDGSSERKGSSIASFEIMVPETIHIGLDFLVTVKLSGLTDEMLKESFSAIITVSGTARFKGTDSKDVLVELVGGTAYLIARAESQGQFFISGRLVNLPEY